VAISDQQREFVEHYLRCWNATQAAIAANYSERSARQTASRLLTKDDIQALIKTRLDELKMETDEVLLRLSEQARAEYAQYFRHYAFKDDEGNTEWVIAFDFDACKADGRLHLIKKVKRDRNGYIEIEFHDAQAALFKLGQHKGLFTADGETPINVNISLNADELARRREMAEQKARQYEDELLNGGDANSSANAD